MDELLDFESCDDVDERLIQRALAPSQSLAEPAPRQRVLSLLDRMAYLLEPGRGAGRLLVVLARMAECDWIEGDLEIRLRAVPGGTEVDLLVFDGLSLVRLHPPLALAVELDELVLAMDSDPAAIWPLGLLDEDPGVEIRLRSIASARNPAVADVVVSPSQAPPPVEDQPTRAMPPGKPMPPGAVDPLRKPTVKVRVVIPPEAYREEQEKPARPSKPADVDDNWE